VANLNEVTPTDVIAGNEFDRMQVKKVYRVRGFLASYNIEPDGDYYLAVTDETAKMKESSGLPK
jgi:hypothetical protein